MASVSSLQKTYDNYRKSVFGWNLCDRENTRPSHHRLKSSGSSYRRNRRVTARPSRWDPASGPGDVHRLQSRLGPKRRQRPELPRRRSHAGGEGSVHTPLLASGQSDREVVVRSAAFALCGNYSTNTFRVRCRDAAFSHRLCVSDSRQRQRGPSSKQRSVARARSRDPRHPPSR